MSGTNPGRNILIGSQELHIRQYISLISVHFRYRVHQFLQDSHDRNCEIEPTGMNYYIITDYGN